MAETLLQIKDLTHRFGGLTAVSDLNFDVKTGEIVGLIGPNGAGKTTVFNLVSGFYVPSEGDILYKGERLNGLKPHQIASRQIGRTFQNIRLWSDMTVLDNIKIAQHYRLGYGLWDAFTHNKKYKEREKELERAAWELLEEFQLANLAYEMPKNLSYGVERRVEIARALSLKPDLLMLDEPAAGLSSADVTELIHYIRWIKENFNLTIWMIEHQMQVIMTLCSTIKVVDFGKELMTGTPDEVRSNPAVIKAYLGEGEI